MNDNKSKYAETIGVSSVIVGWARLESFFQLARTQHQILGFWVVYTHHEQAQHNK